VLRNSSAGESCVHILTELSDRVAVLSSSGTAADTPRVGFKPNFVHFVVPEMLQYRGIGSVPMMSCSSTVSKMLTDSLVDGVGCTTGQHSTACR
jgi:hypothetical protein